MSEIKIEKHKVTMPLITDEELMKVDSCLDKIVQEFIQTKIKDKDLLICQHIIERLQQENKKYKEVIDKAVEYMKDFTFEPLLVNEDRKLIMYNDNLRKFEKILKEVE